MIDKSAENLLGSFLSEALQQGLDNTFSHCPGKILPFSKQKDSEQCDQFMVLTISSLDFKCLVMLHFPENDEFKNLVNEIQQAKVSEEERTQQFLDSLGEMCNVLSGTLKRKLEYTFDIIGMSTPKILNKYAMDVYLSKEPDCNISLKAEINKKFTLVATILLYLGRNCNFNLNDSPKDEDMMEEGEMLLF